MDDAAVEWLLGSEEPAIRLAVRRDLLGESGEDDAKKIFDGPTVTALLGGQQPDGGFGRGSPYAKWTGAHWRLVSLVDLGVPATDARVAAAAEHELAWIVRQGHYRDEPAEAAKVGGLSCMCGSIGGNALAVSSRLGLAADPRSRRVAERLISAQWPDGGWNCDAKALGRRSSFHETLSTSWALYEYATATGHRAARASADRAVELFLEHRLLYSLGTGTRRRGRAHRRSEGEVINPTWLGLRYPSYWHYDILRVLLILSRMGKLDDPRTSDALDELERRRLSDGRWAAEGRWWNPAGSAITPEVVDWGQVGEPNQMITLTALRILRAAGRLSLS
jgi:hypothetical protein